MTICECEYLAGERSVTCRLQSQLQVTGNKCPWLSIDAGSVVTMTTHSTAVLGGSSGSSAIPAVRIRIQACCVLCPFPVAAFRVN